MNIRKSSWGHVDGQEVFSYTLTNDQGAIFRCMEYGAVVTAIEVPDREGRMENVVLGFDSLDQYVKDSPYFGALVGRVAGRIARASWKDHQLTKNEGEHHIHGGTANFSHRVWKSRVVEDHHKIGIEFSLDSPHGDNGYPGNLCVKVIYYWTNENVWEMDILAQTDQETLFNPTNHTYFNLSGNVKNKILNHTLQIEASAYAETNAEKLPTGRLLPVSDTAFDFREPIQMGKALEKHPAGYDTPFKLEGTKRLALKDPESGRCLSIQTDRDAVVVFSTTNMEEDYMVAEEKMSSHRGIALETQELPDAVHHSAFRSIVIAPHQEYRYQTAYKFTVC